LASRTPVHLPPLEDKAFLALVIAISAVFAWILWPFYGAIFWGTALAILFTPLYRRLLRSLWHRPTLAALATLTIVLVMVILPLALIAALVLQEASAVYQRMQSGELNWGTYAQRAFDTLPQWLARLLDRFGLTSVGLVQERLAAALKKSSQFLASHALNAGQNALDFLVNLLVMIYLLFFLLRDGEQLARQIRDSIPLRADHQRELASKFTTVLRATVKGTLVVAAVQGALGGLIFWILGIHAPVLWAVLMAFLSLLPSVGAALVWLPVAIYLLVTGSTWPGLVLLAYGMLVISLIDNVLRPILVGMETRIPDYVVLVSTLGGIAAFGINGLVIGPMIAAMFIAVWDIFYRSRSAIETSHADSSLRV
jgi:predicted PurR-regulated permease PerM